MEDNTNASSQGKGRWTDRFGAVASSMCALHCALCALAPALFGALGLGFLLSHEAELGLSLIAILFAAIALVFAWRQHRSRLVVGFLAIGIIGLVVSRGLEMGDDHHGDHGESHHAEATPPGDDHKDTAKPHQEPKAKQAEGHDEGEDGHGEGEDGHEEGLHALGAGVGVLAGLLLLVGHVLNLRMARPRDDA